MMIDNDTAKTVTPTDIAIIGMAAHLPGAGDIDQFWQNLCTGAEAIERLSLEELRAGGEDAHIMARPNYVPVAAPLSGFDQFDAGFFGFSPKEAAILDPQHRQFLEVAWEALENAAHPPETFAGAIGIFAGCGMGAYLYRNLATHADLVEDTGMFLLRHTGNDKDFLATRVSHIFNLTGPSVNVQTACSTSLVAVHAAVQSLLAGECDMALAGGVTIELPHKRGYLYTAGEILSPDGHCRAFDARAGGTVFGSGAGCVVLRRATDAIRDGDHIWALIKGSAVNNDGGDKAGYLAPSVGGQAECVALAHGLAGVDARSISYVECHGTGTALGDPIEVAALGQAFAETTQETGFCRIGSVKSNIGHLDTAAGVASLIKVALSMTHRKLPATLGYEAPNPAIDFTTSPFVVNDRLTDWDMPVLRAGVNSLGVGGTNAHVILQQAPVRQPQPSTGKSYPLVISARSQAALVAQSRALAAHLSKHPDMAMQDLAFTLRHGRRAFAKRRVLVADSATAAAALLETSDPRWVFDHDAQAQPPEVVFMFPGGGAQYAAMAKGLYDQVAVVRYWLDRGFEVMAAEYGLDLRAIWLGGDDVVALTPSVQLPLLMIVEYGLARFYQSLGIEPAVLIGHSMGENTAAALAGVISFDDCLRLVALRGQLFDRIRGTCMVSVALSATDLAPYLADNLDLACENAPHLSVVSGAELAIADLVARLQADGVETQPIAISIAAHSRCLDQILPQFEAFLRTIPLAAPQIPILSNRTGQVLTDQQAQDPAYWVDHLRHTVMFAQGITALLAKPNRVFIEMGPGRALTSLAQANGVPSRQVISALRHSAQDCDDEAWAKGVFAQVWACGGQLDWSHVLDASSKRVVLPSYQFEKQRYFIEPFVGDAQTKPLVLARDDDVAKWGWRQTWAPKDSGIDIHAWTGAAAQSWLVFDDGLGLGLAVAQRLKQAHQNVVLVHLGDRFVSLSDGNYHLAPEAGRLGYDLLFHSLQQRGFVADHILHAWLVNDGRPRAGSNIAHQNLEYGFWSQVHLLQSLVAHGHDRPLKLSVISSGAQSLRQEPLAWPEKALSAGPVRVAPKELPWLQTAWLDLPADTTPELAPWVIEEALCPSDPAQPVAILRNNRRYQSVLLGQPLDVMDAFPSDAHILMIGGAGGVGRSLSADFISKYGARVSVVSRTAAQGNSEARLHYIKADVTNLEDMQAAKATAEARFGPIYAVIHAAGVLNDAPIMQKTNDQMQMVLAPKVLGTQVLDQVFPDGSIAVLVLFSSTSTQAAAAGQVDYVAANEYLNAYAQSRMGGQTKVLALSWGVWQGVGMAQSTLSGAPTQPLRQPYAVLTQQTSGSDVAFLGQLDAKHWLFCEHQLKTGQQVLPGTAYVELAAEAYGALALPGDCEIQNLVFEQALVLGSAPQIQVRVSLASNGEGYDFKIESCLSVGLDDWVCHATGRLQSCGDHRPAPLDLDLILHGLDHQETGDGLPICQERHLDFGPRWRVLSRKMWSKRQGVAWVSLNDSCRVDSAQTWRLHPAVLDVATGWALDLASHYDPRFLWVPVSYARLRVFGTLSGTVVSVVRPQTVAGDDTDYAQFDVTLTTPAGEVLVEIQGMMMRNLPNQAVLAPLPRLSSLRSSGLRDFRQMLALGIKPDEGGLAMAAALSTALKGDLAQIFVSSVALPDVVQTHALRPNVKAMPTFAPRRADADYIAPSSDVEKRLCQIWSQLLGLEQISVGDSFFDLGGHSLIAVRLFAQIKQIWTVDLPISALFGAPTVAACAQLIEAAMPQKSAASIVTIVEAHTHLVAMHPGPNAAKPPLFMVAGMFGNVLNLRHLAQTIGQDRPFYGLQARGLYGQDTPHQDFMTAASDYIAEMRKVQAHGPYALAGFSGGGLIAWEMARQLEQAGDEVAILVLLDTPLPQRPKLSLRDRIWIKATELSRKGPGYLREWRKNRRSWHRLLRQTQATIAMPAPIAQFHNSEIEAAFRVALSQYVMRPRLGETVLLRPKLDLQWRVSGGRYVSKAREYVFSDNDLTQFAPNLKVIEVPGDHDSMVLEPNVRVLGGKLRSLLAQSFDDQISLDFVQAAE